MKMFFRKKKCLNNPGQMSSRIHRDEILRRMRSRKQKNLVLNPRNIIKNNLQNTFSVFFQLQCIAELF